MSRESKVTETLAAQNGAETAFLHKHATGLTLRVDAVAGSSGRTQKNIDVIYS